MIGILEAILMEKLLKIALQYQNRTVLIRKGLLCVKDWKVL